MAAMEKTSHMESIGCRHQQVFAQTTFNTNQIVHGMYCSMQFRFWDMEAALKLIRERYSWFLPTFEGYGSVVAKGKLTCALYGKTCSTWTPEQVDTSGVLLGEACQLSQYDQAMGSVLGVLEFV